MTVHDLFRDRMTEPNPVLDPLLEPQKLDSRNVIHFCDSMSALDVLAHATARFGTEVSGEKV